MAGLLVIQIIKETNTGYPNSEQAPSTYYKFYHSDRPAPGKDHRGPNPFKQGWNPPKVRSSYWYAQDSNWTTWDEITPDDGNGDEQGTGVSSGISSSNGVGEIMFDESKAGYYREILIFITGLKSNSSGSSTSEQNSRFVNLSQIEFIINDERDLSGGVIYEYTKDSSGNWDPFYKNQISVPHSIK